MRQLDGPTVRAVLDEVLLTMVGGEPSRPRAGGPSSFPLHAWVDVAGTDPGRTVLSTEPATATALARALVGVPPEEDLGADEVRDALGELANMVAGNLKAVRAAGGDLGLPQVADTAPAGAMVLAVDVEWRGAPLRVTVLGDRGHVRRTMKVLVADDSRVMRRIIVRSLRQAGYDGWTVVEAADGAEALALAYRESPDLVLTDWNMPELSGLDVLRALQASGFPGPVGFITSEGSTDMVRKAQEAGAAFVVPKPFTPEALREAMEPVLG